MPNPGRDWVTNTKRMRAELIAPCGMNCYLCRAYRPDKPYIKPCPGCRIDDDRKSRYCEVCRIKNCEKIKGENTYCFQCDRFPCSRLKQLDKRYTTKYAMSMMDNLQHVKAFGAEQFVRMEEVRWECPACGDILCVHKPQCLSCGYAWRAK